MTLQTQPATTLRAADVLALAARTPRRRSRRPSAPSFSSCAADIEAANSRRKTAATPRWSAPRR